jgi:hypothetical protein
MTLKIGLVLVGILFGYLLSGGMFSFDTVGVGVVRMNNLTGMVSICGGDGEIVRGCGEGR